MAKQSYAHKNVLCSQYRSFLLKGKIRAKLGYSQKILRDAGIAPSSDLNEAQTRQSFILPLVSMLGWDLENPFEVCPEERAKGGFIDIRVRAPNGSSVIWEIKRPSVDLDLSKDSGKEAAYQGVGYARTFTDSPYCVVSNFEMTHIFHSYQIPAVENIAQNLIASFTWEDLENGKADSIFALLDRESVENGESKKRFDSFVKNKQIIRASKPLQTSILADLESIRILLAQDIVNSNVSSSLDDIDLAVQLIINRLLFIRCCEDRRIIERKVLSELLINENRWKLISNKIFPIFRSKFNSDIFKENRIADSKKLVISDDCVTAVLSRTYNSQGIRTNEVYDFSMISLEILGSAYENYLAKKLEANNGLISIKIKPELKKSGGICYTPTHIVNAIVHRSLTEALKSKNIQDLKVLDPSCGSGTFLINAFQKLIELSTPKPEKKSEFQAHLPLQNKIKILTDNIFGVDLDRNAVEISKLSLLLKVLEGESNIPDDLHHILPSLTRNIRHGNSLIEPSVGSQFVSAKSLPSLHTLDWKYFLDEINAGEGFDAIIGNPPYVRIQVLQEYFPIESEIYKATYKSASEGNFDLYIPFIERSLSLLNPTGCLGYICPNRIFTNDYAANIRTQISTKGALTEVVNFRAEQVFKGVSTYTCLLFASSGSQDTFRYTESDQGEDIERFCMKYINNDLGNRTSEYSRQVLNGDNWLLAPSLDRSLILELEKSPNTLADYVSDRGAFQGLINGADDVYLIDIQDDGTYYSRALNSYIDIEETFLVPVLKGSADLKRHKSPDVKMKMIFPYKTDVDDELVLVTQQELKAIAPQTMNYFNSCKSLLVKRKALKTKPQREQDIKDFPEKFPSEEDWYYIGKDFYRFSRNQALSCVKDTKLLAPSQFKKPTFFWDETGTFSITGSGSGGGGAWGMFLKEDIERHAFALIAILSSGLMHKWFERRGDLFGGYYIGVDEKIILNAPMPDFNDHKNHKILASLASLARSLMNCEDEGQIIELENSIDGIVKDLYKAVVVTSISAA